MAPGDQSADGKPAPADEIQHKGVVMHSWFRAVATSRQASLSCLAVRFSPQVVRHAAFLSVVILSVGFPLAATVFAASDRGAPPAPDAQRTAQLITDLGAENFAVRQRASRELVTLGISVREALEQAAAGPDAEVRVRARAVLASIRESDFRARLDAFAADFDGSHHQSLPGWEQFSGQLGDSRLSRQLFVEMERSEPELLEALSKGTKPASEVLDARCRVLVDQIMQSQRDMHPSLGTAAALLFVGSTAGVQIDEQLSIQLYSWIIYQPVFQKTAQHGVWSAMLKKLLGQWVVKDTNPAALAQNLLLAASFELRPEALALATRALSDEAAPANARQYAILLMGRFGNKEHVPQLENCWRTPRFAPPCKSTIRPVRWSCRFATSAWRCCCI